MKEEVKCSYCKGKIYPEQDSVIYYLLDSYHFHKSCYDLVIKDCTNLFDEKRAILAAELKTATK